MFTLKKTYKYLKFKSYLKGQLTQNEKSSFTYLLLGSTKEDILKNDLPFFSHTMKVKGVQFCLDPV